jgi:hypothetical protein
MIVKARCPRMSLATFWAQHSLSHEANKKALVRETKQEPRKSRHLSNRQIPLPCSGVC